NFFISFFSSCRRSPGHALQGNPRPIRNAAGGPLAARIRSTGSCQRGAGATKQTCSDLGSHALRACLTQCQPCRVPQLVSTSGTGRTPSQPASRRDSVGGRPARRAAGQTQVRPSTRGGRMASFTLNGARQELAVAADTPLLWALREHLQLTGT